MLIDFQICISVPLRMNYAFSVCTFVVSATYFTNAHTYELFLFGV